MLGANVLGVALVQTKFFGMAGLVPIGRLGFDPETRVLYDGRRVVPLAPLPAQILATLIRAGGDVVSAPEMREALWSDAPVEDRNLNQQIYVLRRVLRRDPRVTIENVPRRGYRLVVAPPAAEVAQLDRPRRRRWLALVWASCTLAVAVIIGMTVQNALQRPASANDRELALGNYLAMSEGPDHLRRAARYYDDLINRAPNDGAAYGGLAMVDVQDASQFTGNFQSRLLAKAKREALIALQSNPQDSNALTSLGILTAAQDQRPDDALRYFNAAIAADPLGELPRLWRAKYSLGTGDVARAGRDFRILSQNFPTSGYAVGQYGKWLVLNHDYARAIPVLEQAVALGGHPGFTRYWLARAYYRRDLDADALRLANVLLGMYPNEVSALVIRMHVEARQGDMRDALADFRTIERTKDVAIADPVGLAAAQIAMGNVGAASRTVKRYLASGNRNIDVLALLRTDPDLAPLRPLVSP